MRLFASEVKIVGTPRIGMVAQGADCVGVDLSDEAIKNAERIADELGCTARFVCCDLYDPPDHLDDQFSCLPVMELSEA